MIGTILSSVGARKVAEKLAEPDILNKMSNNPIMRAAARLAVRGRLEMEKRAREMGRKAGEEERRIGSERVEKEARRVRERQTRNPKK